MKLKLILAFLSITAARADYSFGEFRKVAAIRTYGPMLQALNELTYAEVKQLCCDYALLLRRLKSQADDYMPSSYSFIAWSLFQELKALKGTQANKENEELIIEELKDAIMETTEITTNEDALMSRLRCFLLADYILEYHENMAWIDVFIEGYLDEAGSPTPGDGETLYFMVAMTEGLLNLDARGLAELIVRSDFKQNTARHPLQN